MIYQKHQRAIRLSRAYGCLLDAQRVLEEAKLVCDHKDLLSTIETVEGMRHDVHAAMNEESYDIYKWLEND